MQEVILSFAAYKTQAKAVMENWLCGAREMVQTLQGAQVQFPVSTSVRL